MPEPSTGVGPRPKEGHSSIPPQDRRIGVTAELDAITATDAQPTSHHDYRRQVGRRVRLARINSVLFLDEPTAGLDPEARAELWAQIGALARDEGLTVLLTTHYMEEADKLADRLVIVDRGRVVAEGTAEQLKSELHGDALVVELAVPPTAPPRLDGIRDVTLGGRILRARVDDGARAVPAVLAGLEAAGLAVASVTVARPSLDDVYLRHTGRSYTAEPAPEPELEGASR